MGKAGSAGAWGRSLAIGLPALALLAGCGHRDVVDTPIDWWHGLEGGAIAQQRPPPPGVDDPYPKIGTTPAAAPQVASVDLRRSVTAQLIEQRNLSTRLNAHDPLPTPAVAPARTAGPAASAAVPGPTQSSATLDAAEAPPAPPLAPPPAPLPAASVAAPRGRPVGAASDGGEEAELALPDVVPAAAGAAAAGPVVLPAIPSAPPPAPGLPGIALPPLPSYAAPARPRYALAQRAGDPLRFAAGSDTLDPGQSGTLVRIAAHRGGRQHIRARLWRFGLRHAAGPGAGADAGRPSRAQRRRCAGAGGRAGERDPDTRRRIRSRCHGGSDRLSCRFNPPSIAKSPP